MKEEWRDVVGYEGCYQVSNKGRVRSVSRLASNGTYRTGRIRKLHLSNGYLAVGLRKDGEGRTTRVHRLVLESFYCLRPKGLVACHNDGNKENNNIDNLRWDTQRSNIHDMMRHGNHSPGKVRGEQQGNAKLCDLDVWLIKNTIVPNYYWVDFFNVSPSCICGIRKGVSWRHI